MSDGRFPPGSRVTWAAPNEWPNEWREWWPECAMDADDVIADAEEPTFDVGTVVADDLQDGAVLVVWDGLGRCANDEDGDGMPYLYGWVIPAFALSIDATTPRSNDVPERVVFQDIQSGEPIALLRRLVSGIAPFTNSRGERKGVAIVCDATRYVVRGSVENVCATLGWNQ